jgi:hypothetical protein
MNKLPGMKALVAFCITSVSFLSLPVTVFAQLQLGTDNPNPLTAAGDRFASDPGSLIASLIYFVFVVAVILALGFLVWGGIKWLTSGGDKDSVAGARNTIIAAIIGLVIIFLAYAILNFVVYFLTGDGLESIEISQITGTSASQSGNAFCGNGGQRPCDNNGLAVNQSLHCNTASLNPRNQNPSGPPDWRCMPVSGGGPN